MISFKLSGDLGVLPQIETRRAALFAALVERINYWDQRLQQRIQQKLSGEVLHQRSGKLKRSIEVIPAVADEAAGTISGRVVGAGGPAWYGKLHEFGAYSRDRKGALRHLPRKIVHAIEPRGIEARHFGRAAGHRL
jgi:hypothetical protein